MRLLVAARNGEIGIEHGRICLPLGYFDIELAFPGADVLPGLINAHDHLHRNHYGRLGRPPYRTACAWAADIQQRYRGRIAQGRRMSRREALLAGAWKNLFAGVTTVVHHDPWEAAFDESFPIRVVGIRTADNVAKVDNELGRAGPYAIHLAEGLGPGSADEVRALDALGLVTDRLIAVHCVGVDEDGIERLRDAGSAVAWCPSSNHFLFGRTAPAALLTSGVDVLIGSDSLLTGIGDLLDELRFARSLNILADDELTTAAGERAAKRLGIAAPALDPGAEANLFVTSKPLLEASSADIQLVIAGGQVRVAAPALAPRLDAWLPGGRLRTIGGVTRWTHDGALGLVPAAATTIEERVYAGIC